MSQARVWEVVPLTAAFGAEFQQIDLRSPLESGDVDQLLKVFYERGMVVFRNQDLDVSDQIRVLGYFGTVAEEFNLGHSSLLSNNREDAFPARDSLVFHSDYSFTNAPPPVLSLYAVEIASGASPTFFCSAAAAFESLPDALRDRISGLKALHLSPPASYKRTERVRLADLEQAGISLSDCVHATKPLVIEHPENGRPVLCVNRLNVSHICELEGAEGEALLEALYTHIEGSVYEHQWSEGDLVVWDNIALQHARPPTASANRTLRRVVVNEAPMQFIAI